ncbi:MAG TPA: CHRD domain-containing protein, partial [Caulobacter sp.]|nr:CHRD domain-containing protein [Caulobacter sp.]
MRALTLALALGAAALASPAAADVFVFRTHMSGLLEEPANASPGTGFAKVTFDDVAFTMEVDAAWQDLTSIVTAAHIHGPTAEPGEGVAGVMTPTPSFPGFPTGTSGSYNMIFDMNQASSYRPGFLTAHGDDPHAAGLVVLAALQ